MLRCDSDLFASECITLCFFIYYININHERAEVEQENVISSLQFFFSFYHFSVYNLINLFIGTFIPFIL